MKPVNHLALMVVFALAAGTPSPSFAEGLSARSGRVIQLTRDGKYAEALPLAQAMVADQEKRPPSRDLGAALHNLADVYAGMGQDAQAEQLYKRALALREKALPPGHPDVGVALNNLATVYEKQDRHSDSEPLFRHALAIFQKIPGAERAVATLMDNLGQVYKAEGRYADAEPVIKQSLAIREKVLGRDHIDVARSLTNLGDLYQRQERCSEAQPIYERAFAIRERTVGLDHPETAISANNLASLYQAEGRTADALPLLERLIAIGRAQIRVALPVLLDAPKKQLMPPEKAFDEALDVIQHGAQSSAASAVNKLAVRVAAGSDHLAELVRRDQDLASEADALDKAIISALLKQGSPRDAASGRNRLAAIAAERANLQKTFATEFPDYAALSNPLPLKTKEIQALLSATRRWCCSRSPKKSRTCWC